MIAANALKYFLIRSALAGNLAPLRDLAIARFPIQERFPGYADLPPAPFELERMEVDEEHCLREAARRRFGDERRQGFEPTIAAVIAGADDR